MENIKGDMFLAESSFDEASMLMGKFNALKTVWDGMPQLITAEFIGHFFGFSEVRDEEIEKLQKESDKYWKWYTEESEKNVKLTEHIEKIERTVERLSTLYRLSCEEKGAENGTGTEGEI